MSCEAVKATGRENSAIVTVLPQGALLLPLIRILRRKPILVLFGHRFEADESAASGNSVFMSTFQSLRKNMLTSIDNRYVCCVIVVVTCDNEND